MATITPELRQEIERAGEEPVRVEDPVTNKAYLLVREDVYKKLLEAMICDHSDLSLMEYEEYHPLAETS